MRGLCLGLLKILKKKVYKNTFSTTNRCRDKTKEGNRMGKVNVLGMRDGWHGIDGWEDGAHQIDDRPI